MRVHFDLDSTLVHSVWPSDANYDRTEFNFSLETGEHYGVFVRPYALEIIDYARTMAGWENVYILTKSKMDYALAINELAGFDFEGKNICDSDLMGYALGCVDYPCRDGRNILIDDFDYHHDNVQQKLKYLRTTRDNFLQIPTFQLGNDVTNQAFYFKSRAFIKEKLV